VGGFLHPVDIVRYSEGHRFCMRATPGPHDNGLAVRTEGDVLGFSVEKHVLHQVTTLKFLKRGVWGKFCAAWFAVI